LWARRTAHLLQTRHGILGIFFRQPKDPYDRAARIACVSIHVVACMCVNIIWLGAYGFPDANMVAIGMFTGLILVPILPMCASIFKTIAPAQRDRQKKKKNKKAEERPKSAGVSPLRLASRRARVEVAGTVEAVDNPPPPGTGAPGPPAEPRPSVPPSRNITYDQLQEAVPRRTAEQRGPRTPEVTSTCLPRPDEMLRCCANVRTCVCNNCKYCCSHLPLLCIQLCVFVYDLTSACVSRNWVRVVREPQVQHWKRLDSWSQDRRNCLQSGRRLSTREVRATRRQELDLTCPAENLFRGGSRPSVPSLGHSSSWRIALQSS
jgi:hypothetical protein